MYSENDWRDYLAHHGIKGQVHGVRNGPPYPLNPTISRAIKVGHNPGGTGGGGVSNMPGLKISASPHGWPFKPKKPSEPTVKPKTPRELADENDKKWQKERDAAPLDQKTGLHLKTKEMTMQQDAERVNPRYRTWEYGVYSNCAFCSMAYDLRRRGYDVKAGLLNDGMFEKQIAGMYKDAKFKNISSAANTSLKVRGDMVEKEFLKQGDGARGIVTVSWSGWGGGHAMGYEIANGKFNLVDAQVGKVYSKKEADDIFNSALSWDINYMRTDNLEPNYKKLKEKGIVE